MKITITIDDNDNSKDNYVFDKTPRINCPDVIPSPSYVPTDFGWPYRFDYQQSLPDDFTTNDFPCRFESSNSSWEWNDNGSTITAMRKF